MKKKVYVSGALTGLSNPQDIKTFYENIANVCSRFEIEAYVPHLVSDPIKNPTMTAREVYELDRNQVANSNLIIVYAGVPSFGVGMEVEIACEYKVPVILLMEKSAQVSRMVRGNPTVIAELRFDDFSNALEQLANWLGNQ
jgi:nucleoside 2-deoxyribosyltransferase